MRVAKKKKKRTRVVTGARSNVGSIWPNFGLIFDPSHVTDLSWPIDPFGLSTPHVTPSHAMAYGRNSTVSKEPEDSPVVVSFPHGLLTRGYYSHIHIDRPEKINYTHRRN